MSAEAVKVVVRCRPMNERENRLNCEVVLNMDTDIGQVQLRKPKAKESPPKLFTFDGVFYTHDTTEQIYEDICFPLVEGVLNGYNGTVFAYGQTGCGKSYTMMGVDDPPANRGVIPRTFDHIFDQVAVSTETKYLLTASYLEIYNEEVRDLLGRDVKKRLELHEHPERGVYVQGLSTHKVHNVQDLGRVMELGSKNRSVGATLMNVDSSRSHSIFTIDIEMVQEGGARAGLRAGRLNLVDLAGSERQSKTGSTGDRLKEATKINLSLSALGNVISALVDGRSTHIPYRDSKLTRLLQSSLGGNTKTIMVACISPADNNYDETLSTLRYANRAKNIKNKPRINEDPKDALLRQYQEEIEKLKQLLSGGGASLQATPTAGEREREEEEEEERRRRDWEAEREAIRREYERKMAELRQQYDEVHADKAMLQGQLSELQRQQQLELENLQNQLNQSANNSTSGPPGVPPATDQTRPPEATGSDRLATSRGGGGDVRQLREHEVALQRLEELQLTMIGGERAGDQELKEGLQERRKRAEDKRELLLRASRADDDDGIIERIFNSLTDEVRAKSRALERNQMKLRSAEEDIADLQTEFELERQGYLDIIRNQGRLLKLHDQLLMTVAGLVRRDCNFYNIEKIRNECTWDLDREEWNVPQVTVTKTTLSPVSSHKSVQKRSSSTSTLTTSPPNSLGAAKMKGASPSTSPRGRITTETEDGEGRGSGGELDYFKPKRALELLAEGAQYRGGGASTGGSGTLVNSASVHGLETLLAGDVGSPRRRGRLQSIPAHKPGPHSIPQPGSNSVLPLGHHSIPQSGLHSIPQSGPQPSHHDVLETVERKKSKWRSLEPLDKRRPLPP